MLNHSFLRSDVNFSELLPPQGMYLRFADGPKVLVTAPMHAVFRTGGTTLEIAGKQFAWIGLDARMTRDDTRDGDGRPLFDLGKTSTLIEPSPFPQLTTKLSGTIVVISCGAKKRAEACAARDLYVGTYFRAALQYALSLTGGWDPPIFILSAKYGLISARRWIEPYELRMGQPGSVTVETLRRQAEELGISEGNVGRVVVLGGEDYRQACAGVWRKIETPLAGKGGLFQQIAWMRQRANVECGEECL